MLKTLGRRIGKAIDGLIQGPPNPYDVEYRDLSALRRCPVHGEKLRELEAVAASSSRIGSLAEVTVRLQRANEIDDECQASCGRTSLTVPAAYAAAPDLYDEEQALARPKPETPLRVRLLRFAALADRQTPAVPAADGKAIQAIRSAARALAAYDQEHGTAAGPIDPAGIDAGSALEALRNYVRQEYAAWLHTQREETPDTP